MMRVERVPIEWVHRTWPLVEKYIADALVHAQGEVSVEHARVYVTTGEWVLFVAVDDSGVKGAATVQMMTRPMDRVAFVTAIGGKLISSSAMLVQFKQALASMGATALEGAARESVARLWSRHGFHEKYRIVGVKL